MSPLVEITGTGAYVPAEGPEGRGAYLRRGDTADIPKRLADEWVGLGIATLVRESPAPTEAAAAGESPAPTSVDDMSKPQLLAYAKEHDIPLGGARNKPDIAAAIKAAKAERANGAETPLVNEQPPDSSTPGGDDDQLPDDLDELDDESLLALAVKWDVEVPEDADRDQLLDLLKAADGDPPADD